MAAVDSYSRTPSLTNSEETIASSNDLYQKPLPHPPQIEFPKSKGKERASNVAVRPPSTPPNFRNSRYNSTYGVMHAFIRTWSQPRILQHLLSYISWTDFYAVSRTCRDSRQIFRNQDIKDLVLSRFVPGYSSNSTEDRDEDVRVSLADLEALMLSQSLPLHQYPMHAVHVVLADGAISPPAQAFSDRLIRLAQAHSRFVLFLRSRAPPWQINFDSDDLFSRQGSLSGLRQLTFPAPLSYFDPAIQKPLPLSPPELKKRNSKRKQPSKEPAPPPIAGSPPSPVKTRRSIFGRNKERVPLPAPKSSPPSIKYYSSFGRTRNVRSMSMTDDESGPTFSRHSRFMTDVLTPPRSPFAHPRSSSSNSSLGSIPRSVPPTLQPSLSQHDLSNAILRTRAPILRVFVPCSTLAASVDGAESQLFTSGLWPHLRVGDVVCNLGYVPEDSVSARGWLIYTGKVLYPFFPPEPAPVPDAKALPSPLYYSHLLPLFENLRIILEIPRGMQMALNLALLTSSAPSPHSRAGFVRVKRYSWLGRLRVREDETEALGLGEGWAGEWVLEAEGTKEGRQVLIDAIADREEGLVEREWLIVREKSSAGKVWLRAIPEQRALDNLSVEL